MTGWPRVSWKLLIAASRSDCLRASTFSLKDTCLLTFGSEAVGFAPMSDWVTELDDNIDLTVAPASRIASTPALSASAPSLADPGNRRFSQNPARHPKETLAHIMEHLQPGRARRQLAEWVTWARRSRLRPFAKLAATIERHREGILAYVDSGLTNGPIEGLNNKTRLITRIAFGFHSADALRGMIFLCCGGIELNPPLP